MNTVIKCNFFILESKNYDSKFTMEQKNNQSPSIALDPFFEEIHDGEWNACIGSQGCDENYVDGYIEAAQELAAAMLDKRLYVRRDTLVMPILYNCRHGLELSLKYAIARLHKTGMLMASHPANHDIESHWQHLQSAAVGSISALGDSTLKRLISNLEPYVKSLAAIDDDGQELRYALNRNGKTSLSGKAIVNLRHVHQSIQKLSELLLCLKLRVLEIEEERHTGTYTANCSRKDLAEIAIILGNNSTWKDDSFLEKKDIVSTQFSLSRGKFSDAIDSIRKSRPLAALVGLETSLKYLTDEKAVEVLRLWIEANPQKEQADDLALNYFDRDWGEYKEWAERAKQLEDSTREMLSMEEFADLQTLYYLGRDLVYGEHYEHLVNEAILAFGQAVTNEDVRHLMSKTNLLDAVAKGVEQAGRISLARNLQELRAADNA